MATEVIMPKVDMVMDNGTFVEWLKQEGEQVEKGDPLFVVLTDKANIEIEAPASGILAGLVVVTPAAGVVKVDGALILGALIIVPLLASLGVLGRHIHRRLLGVPGEEPKEDGSEEDEVQEAA